MPYSESWHISANYIGKQTEAQRDCGTCQGRRVSVRAWIEIFVCLSVCHDILCSSPYTVILRIVAEIITTLLFIEDLFYARQDKMLYKH